MDSKQIVAKNFDEMVYTLQKVITFDTTKNPTIPITTPINIPINTYKKTPDFFRCSIYYYANCSLTKAIVSSNLSWPTTVAKIPFSV